MGQGFRAPFGWWGWPLVAVLVIIGIFFWPAWIAAGLVALFVHNA